MSDHASTFTPRAPHFPKLSCISIFRNSILPQQQTIVTNKERLLTCPLVRKLPSTMSASTQPLEVLATAANQAAAYSQEERQADSNDLRCRCPITLMFPDSTPTEADPNRSGVPFPLPSDTISSEQSSSLIFLPSTG